MKRALGLIAVVAMASTGCSSITTHVDYDRSADLDSYRTFAWADTAEMSLEDSSPLMHARVKRSIQTKLIAGGLEEVPDSPDLYVTYHSEEHEEMRLNTTSYNYGYGRGWGWDPYWGGRYGGSTTTVTSYTQGTLIIDVWDAETKNLIWRGTVEGIVSENPEKDAKTIEAAIDKLVEQWRKMRSTG